MSRGGRSGAGEAETGVVAADRPPAPRQAPLETRQDRPSDQGAARLAGALFVLTMAAGVADSCLVAPVLEASLAGAPLDAVNAERGGLLAGALLGLAMAFGVALIAILLFPVLARRHRTVAIGYVCARSVECVLLLAGPLVSLLLLDLGQEGLRSAGPDRAMLELQAVVALKARLLAYQAALLALGLGSLPMCLALWRARLVPGIVAGLGTLGYALLAASAALDVAGVIDTRGGGAILYLPGALFEVVLLPGWLMFKGLPPAPAEAT